MDYMKTIYNRLSAQSISVLAFILSIFISFSASSAQDIIIDNGDPGTSSTGSWRVSGGSDPYGANSLYSKDAGSTYTFETALSGPYDVFFRWTGWSSRCTAVPVEIYDGDNLLDTLDVNQQENASQWYLLGTYTFSGTARILVRAVGSSCSTCVDAVRFVSGVPAELDYIMPRLLYQRNGSYCRYGHMGHRPANSKCDDFFFRYSDSR
jgi:hypothetical protein